MRKAKTVRIDDREVTVKELRVKDIRRLLQTLESLSSLDQVLQLLPDVTDLKPEDVEELSPSELKVVWDAFREVNDVFFGLLKETGLLQAMKASVLKELTGVSADSLVSGTV